MERDALNEMVSGIILSWATQNNKFIYFLWIFYKVMFCAEMLEVLCKNFPT